MKRLYVAYGSNLNLEQMKHRCPTARIYGKGMIKDYKLYFKGMNGNAVLTIEPCEDSTVPVVIWEIKEADEKALDRYEGYPNVYYKEDIEVELETGETVTAMVYIMGAKVGYNEPSWRYYEAVVEGYHDFDFDTICLEKAISSSIKKKN